MVTSPAPIVFFRQKRSVFSVTTIASWTIFISSPRATPLVTAAWVSSATFLWRTFLLKKNLRMLSSVTSPRAFTIRSAVGLFTRTVIIPPSPPSSKVASTSIFTEPSFWEPDVCVRTVHPNESCSHFWNVLFMSLIPRAPIDRKVCRTVPFWLRGLLTFSSNVNGGEYLAPSSLMAAGRDAA